MPKWKMEKTRYDERRGFHDSVRISPNINRTAVIEARCDVRAIATIVAYFDKIEYSVYTKSDAVGQAIKTLANILVANSLIEECTDLEVAADFMNSRFRSTSRDRRAMMHVQAIVTKGETMREFSPLSRQAPTMEELEKSALEWMKEYDPDRYEEVKRKLEENKRNKESQTAATTTQTNQANQMKHISGDGEVKLSEDAMKVPDLMGLLPIPVEN